MALVFVALGSNLGDRAAALAGALAGLECTPGVRLLAATAPVPTVPLGGRAQPEYLNAMALLEVTISPAELLRRCHELESLAGRVRRERWASRELDLDIVLFGDLVSDDPALSLPHPGLRDRTFWQEQLAELAVVHHG
ncbi:MAG TPA: 2-amino-4-hydroxy-6-hydroxymethyldihydropteridine diphosphokinase [Gemmatimonadales bacterium]|nr:2-amino-4-hydroxy-6-hydroxymethyldihydropteridine diphosphokinase [Gemmatimonadales bacterium]